MSWNTGTPFDGIDMERLLQDAVAVALRDERPESFLAWLRDNVGPYLGVPAGLVGQADEDRAVLDILAWQLGRAIWNGLPLPGNQFKPRPIPSPGRNDPCPCGSGTKYKHCCGRLPPMPALQPIAFWPLVIGQLSRERLRDAIERGQIPLEGLLIYAGDLRDEGHPRKAVEVLEPQFTGSPPRTDELAEAALGLLCDLYNELGHGRKKHDLLRGIAETARRSPLRSGAWQRLSIILVENGDSAGAWQAFQKAQQDAPDAVGVVLLEIHLLVGEQRYREASERATFWLRRLRKKGGEDQEELLAHLEAVAEDPAGALARVVSQALGGMGGRLQEWLGRVQGRRVPAYVLAEGPGPLAGPEAIRAGVRDQLRGMGVSGEQLELALHQAVGSLEAALAEGEDASAGRGGEPVEAGDRPGGHSIETPPDLRALEEEWRRVFPVPKPFSVHDTPFGDADPWEPQVEAAWSAWLEAHPEAFDSLEILDDLATALSMHPQLGASWLDDALLGPVLARAAAIVDAAVAGHAAPRLEWGLHHNRPALRSLLRLGWLHRRAERVEEELALAERLVAMNPNDNHGLRTELMRGYLAAGHDEAAIDLAARFPNDVLVDTRFGRSLALFRLGHLEAASQALTEALKQSPKVARYLLAERCKTPKIDPTGIRLGGDDEAWLYRSTMRDVWKATPGALVWLAQVARASK